MSNNQTQSKNQVKLLVKESSYWSKNQVNGQRIKLLVKKWSKYSKVTGLTIRVRFLSPSYWSKNQVILVKKSSYWSKNQSESENKTKQKLLSHYVMI